MLSASLRKSVTDLTRRRARTVFTVLTLAIAVASISFFAIPTLIDRAMQDEVRAGRLADVTIATAARRAHRLSSSPILAALPNVAAVEPRSSVDVRVLVGERRAPARVIGDPGLRAARESTSHASSRERFPATASCSPTSRTRTSASTTATPGTPLTVLGEGGDAIGVRREWPRANPSGRRAGSGRERDRPLRGLRRLSPS